MVKTAIDEYIELASMQNSICCSINMLTGKRNFFSWKEMKKDKTDGFYYNDEETFFALIESLEGPIILYKDNLYPLKKDLSIDICMENEIREFVIEQYDIHIKYRTPKYIDFDECSKEEDLDLFFMIYKSYKSDEIYEKFKKKA